MEKLAQYRVPIHPYPICEDGAVEAFYDRSLQQALGQLSVHPGPGPGYLWDADEVCRFAEAVARRATERRFGVKLDLPGDGG